MSDAVPESPVTSSQSSGEPDTTGSSGEPSFSPPVSQPAPDASASAGSDSETEEPGPEPTAGSEATPAVPTGLNDRGNLEESVGEVSIFQAESGTEFAALEAEEIQTDFQCTGAAAQESVNGQFVAISFSVAAQPELAESGWPSLYISAREFRAWDADDEPVPDPVGSSAGCVEPDELLPSPVEPGEDLKGLIILDVPTGSGSAAFTVGGFEGSYGWEWEW
ncbi:MULTISPECIES: hypothetical protein [unclassified Arthrobacter]|uniref:hypothetical protein n=1 Tax=unclassified Arthrobacter TaxID=235627 RepID=UPI001491D0BE|nr:MULTISPECIES: hypothetical protein [unclassified Arthrobacter]NOJ62795.1 hypothetical protein [Arthrobacter sp. 147(2020)]